jgi:hypothetical protein
MRGDGGQQFAKVPLATHARDRRSAESLVVVA